MNTKAISMLLIFCALTIAGCNQQEDATAPRDRHFDTAQLMRGKALFEQNCARCHGIGAEGAFAWRVQQPDGSYLPPPLNGTGHAWHHPRAALIDVIDNGTGAQGGTMPAWGDKLTQAQIGDIVTWIESLWPKPLYDEWWQKNRRYQDQSG